MTARVLSLNNEDVVAYSSNLYICGIVCQGYFVMVAVRDIIIQCSHLLSESPMAFWNALFVHTAALPVDIIVIALTMKLRQSLHDGTEIEHCEKEVDSDKAALCSENIDTL